MATSFVIRSRDAFEDTALVAALLCRLIHWHQRWLEGLAASAAGVPE